MSDMFRSIEDRQRHHWSRQLIGPVIVGILLLVAWACDPSDSGPDQPAPAYSTTDSPSPTATPTSHV